MKTERQRGRLVQRRSVVAVIGILPFVARTAHPSALEPAQWPALKRAIRDRYPDVPHITTDALHAMHERGEMPILIDARAGAEYRVSHLQGARRAESASEAIRMLEAMPKDRPVVVYCSVGYRSAVLARALANAGYTRVVNLEGSIFEWANKGFALYRGAELARFVHPYDARWGALLDRRLWSTERP